MGQIRKGAPMPDPGGWVDVSVPICDGMLHWPGDEDVRVRKTATHASGDGAEVTTLEMSAHTGTHLDAPRHFVEDGAAVGAFPLELGIGPARVVSIPASVTAIRAEDLGDEALEGVARLLVKTSNSERLRYDAPFDAGYAHLTAEAAERLARSRVRLVGIDYLSIGGPGADGDRTHRVLLGAGIWVLEGLRLGAVAAGRYDMVCLPLSLPDADGAPARVVLSPRSD